MKDPKSVVCELFRRVWNDGDLDAIPDYRDDRCESMGLDEGTIVSNAQFAEFVRMVRGAFDRFELSVDQAIAEGDDVSVRLTMRGVQKGREVRAQGAAFVVVKDGKAVRGWNVWDTHAIADGLAGRKPVSLRALLLR